MSNFAAYEDSSGTLFTGHFEYEGSVGPAGYTPERGVDYWTPDDVAAMEAEVQEAVNTEHAADFTKLDGIEAGAEVNIIEDIKVNGVSQTVTDKSVDISVPTNTNQLTNGAGFIKSTTKDLVYYTKTTDSGRKIVVSINPSTYVMTVSLRTTSNTEISSSSIDLPLESMVVSGTYDEETKKVILTLQSGSTVEFSIADLISGLVPDSRTIAGVDLADDITKNELLVALNIEDGSQANVLEGVQVDGTDLAITNKKVNITGLATEEEYNQLLDQIPTTTATGETITVNDSANLPLKSFELQGNATQDGIPTPDSPVAIHVVTGDNTVKVVGKNLFDYLKALADGGNTYDSANNDLWFTTNNTKPFLWYPLGIKENTQYTFTVSLHNRANETNAIRFDAFYSDGTSERIISYNATNTEQVVLSGTTSANKTLSYIKTEYTDAKNVALRVTATQLEQGSTATDYEPYQAQAITLPLGDIELAKIGNYADRIYKDNSKWYLYKALASRSITAISSIYDSVSSGFISAMLTISTMMKNSRQNGLCDKLTTLNSPSNASQEGICFGTTGNSNIYLILSDTRISENTTTKWNEYLASNPYEVYYPLATPTTTEITDTALITALEQVLSMTTYKTTTNAFTLTVSDNATPTLQVEYRKDLSMSGGGEENTIESISVNNVAQTPDVNKNVDITVPVITYGTTDLTPGVSSLTDGTFYFVYE